MKSPSHVCVAEPPPLRPEQTYQNSVIHYRIISYSHVLYVWKRIVFYTIPDYSVQYDSALPCLWMRQFSHAD